MTLGPDGMPIINRAHWLNFPDLMTFAKHDTGGGKDDEGDDDDEDDDDDDEDEADDPDEGKTVEELRAELKQTRDRLSKASGSSASKRAKIKELKTALEAKGAPAGKGTEDKTDVDLDAEREAARIEGRKEGERLVKSSKAEAALALAGATKVARLVKLLDIDELELIDGKVDGLDEAIDELKGDYPELFSTKRRRKSIAGEKDDEDAGKSAKPKTSSDRQLEYARTGRKA